MFKCFFLFSLLGTSLASQASGLIIPKTTLSAEQKTLHLLSTSGTQVIVSEKEIKSAGAKNLTQLLQNISSIRLHYSNDATAPVISMRGFGDNGTTNTLILLNGFPLQSADSASGFLNLIPIENIKNIEIMPESAGVLYGNTAVGGVINISTQQPEKFSTRVNLGFGSYNANSKQVSLENKIHHFYYLVSAKKRRTNNNRTHNRLEQTEGLLNLGYDNTNNQIQFSYHNTVQNEEYPGSTLSPSNTERQLVHFYAYLLQVRHQFNNAWRLNNRFSYLSSDVTGFLDGHFMQHRQTLNLMPKLIGELPFANIMTISGLNINHDQYAFQYPKDTQFNVNENSQTIAAYTHWTIPFKQKFSVSLGVSGAKQTDTLNQINGQDHAFITEESLAYKPNTAWRMYFRRAGSYRFPKADEAGEGGKMLKVQTGASYETGLTWHTNRTLLQLEAYLIDLNNEIAFAAANPAAPADQANRNLDPTQRIGLLLHTKYNLSPTLSIYGDYNLVDAYYRSGPFSHKKIPLVSAQTGKLGLGYHFQTHWTAYASTLFTGGFYPAGDDRNQHAQGGYVTANSHLTFHENAWTIGLRINNLLNKRYSTYTVFSPYVKSLAEYPAPGRNYWVTLAYDFT